ncbi:DNA-binding transcriptional regulator, AcrR family [Nonomuraea solani]|uniref:DNA-binding transcriptional regulator, AcrR family n=1 Tax=Nonomuraea solani TaxID=1144553 RepID=A0A1H6EZQ0_9ACTN|nr:TetR/AcrR family transcriptional regulator [Nonomuraea solani]SEH02174.1 DNA-binding transcriptional regulator, AcrR family [Nonomuraea solani]
MPQPPPARRRLKPGARRRQILDVATREIAASGFRGASLAEIAENVGVSQPGLLHHFPSKAALLLAVLEQKSAEDTAIVDEVFADAEGTVGQAITALVEVNQRDPERIRLYTVTAAESIDAGHPAHDFYLRRYQGTRARLAERLAKDRERGRLPETLDVAEVATEILALLDGLQFQWLLDPGVDMTGPVRAYFARLYGRT